MQALLSYDQSPPLAAPFRFFLSAPFFGLLAGALLLWAGPDALASRWTPATLAITHLITVGFLLQVMLGALIQILPVVAGANLAQPLRVATVVHLSTVIGTLFLVAAFLSFDRYWFIAASVFLGVGALVFLGAAGHALLGVPSTGPTIAGLKLALPGLSVTLILGVLMTLSIGGSIELPLLQVADIHAVWGFIGWGLVLLVAVAYVVVPMFQLTPNYPRGLGTGFLVATLLALVAWTLLDLGVPGVAASFAGALVLTFPAAFALVTLRLQLQSKRPRFDTTQWLWRVAMVSTLLACLLAGTALCVPVVSEWSAWPVLLGVLVLFGGFVSVITGMLYKIVPFLIWLHLQNLGRGRLLAPNMKKIIDETSMQRQMLAHGLACLCLAAAAVWPEVFVYPAGAALILAQALLLLNLRAAMRVHAAHRQKLAAHPSPAA